jgi:S1-C subfamily serine protease
MVNLERNGVILSKEVILKNKNGTLVAIRSSDVFFNELLGADLQQLSNEEKDDLNISTGLKVMEITNGILSRAGINEGFIITEINNSDVDTESELLSAINNTKRNIIRMKGIYPNGVIVSYEFML